MSVDEDYININALLSRAAHADDLNSGNTGSALVKKLVCPVDGIQLLTMAQAIYIANNFIVIEQQTKTSSGFSATFFQNVHTAEYYLAVDDSNTFRDNLSKSVNKNSRNKAVDMLNFYLRLTGIGNVPQYELQVIKSSKPPSRPHYFLGSFDEILYVCEVLTIKNMQPGLGLINSTTELTVTGGCLGKCLASIFALLVPDSIDEITI